MSEQTYYQIRYTYLKGIKYDEWAKHLSVHKQLKNVEQLDKKQVDQLGWRIRPIKFVQ